MSPATAKEGEGSTSQLLAAAAGTAIGQPVATDKHTMRPETGSAKGGASAKTQRKRRKSQSDTTAQGRHHNDRSGTNTALSTEFTVETSKDGTRYTDDSRRRRREQTKQKLALLRAASKDGLELSATLTKGLYDGTYDCMICYDSVRKTHQVWSCRKCYQVRYARTPVARARVANANNTFPVPLHVCLSRVHVNFEALARSTFTLYSPAPTIGVSSPLHPGLGELINVGRRVALSRVPRATADHSEGVSVLLWQGPESTV